MAKVKGPKDELAGKTKRLVGEVLGDQKLHDEGKEQEKQGRDDVEKPIKPLGNLGQLT
jgi:uncharacterized protein YjbJ (UPF0337 family)